MKIKILALIGVNDIVRENATEVIKELNRNKVETIMLTGDNKETAEKIAKEIGITKLFQNVLPTEKAKVVKRIKKNRKNICNDVWGWNKW